MATLGAVLGCGRHLASTVVTGPRQRSSTLLAEFRLRRDSVLQADNGSASLPLDARRPNHLAPLLGKFDNEFAELGGRACKWFRAQIDQPRFEHGISKGGINLLIEDVDDLRRRRLGGSNAIPTAGLVTRHKIADRRDIREYIPQT